MSTPPARSSAQPAPHAATTDRTRRRPRMPRAAAALVAPLALSLTGVGVLTGCGSSGGVNKPPSNLPAATSVVQQLATALGKGDLSGVTFASSSTSPATDYKTVMQGMDGLLPTVTPGDITYDGSTSTASAVLHQTWLVGTSKLSYDSTAHLTHASSGWQVDWAPSIVEPQLTAQTRLRHVRVAPKRAAILSYDKQALMELRPVYEVGIDKTLVSGTAATTAAKKLATLLKMDAATYVKKVSAAGAKAWVVAETVRKADLPSGVFDITGARANLQQATLGPSKTFAESILGGVGEPTAKQVSASHGDILDTDEIGTSGLELRYDAQLRGTPGHTIDIIARSGMTPTPVAQASVTVSTSASAASSSTTASSDASTESSSGTSGNVLATLLHTEPVSGKPVQTTLNTSLQTKAEKVLSSQSGVASMVVLDRSTGAIRVAANSTAAGADSVATTGRVAPGSTMKIADSLALVRQGWTASSKISCPTSATVNGKKFTNDSWYPSSDNGTVTLATAVAQSCNTAFVGVSSKVTQAQQLAAASSLGMGTDYDSGFASFYGSIPATSDAVTHAADMIGQGQVTASPMAMAAVAASVGSAHTVIPNLVVGNAPKSTAAALTSAEASQLQTLMKTVVSSGTASSLKGVVTGAKTGTAEYASGSTTKTHAWMICYTGQYAIAVMVYDGTTGAGTAGPLVKSFLS